MKIKKEFKVGVFAIIVILASWWGIKWLGGIDLFKSYTTYNVRYEKVSSDLQVSSRVFIRGVEVGNVRDITLKNDGVIVEIAVEDQYSHMVPENSVAMISEGMMGGAEITIIQGDAETIARGGSYLNGEYDEGIMSMVEEKVGALVDNLGITINNINDILIGNKESLTGLIANIESISGSINDILASSKSDIDSAMNNLNAFTKTLADNSSHLEATLQNIDTFTGELAEGDIIAQLTTTVESLNNIIDAVNSGEGSVGKLLNDNALYDALSTAGNNLAVLLEDLKAHPMRYVHFSLFGQSEEKIAQKAAKKAAREQKRAAKAAN